MEYALTLGGISVFFLMMDYFFHHTKGLFDFDVKRTNSLRGILAILIILHHLSSTTDIPALKWFHTFGAPVVSVFFFISGYGLMKSYMIKGGSYLSGFLSKRLGKILPLYIFGSICMAIVMLCESRSIGDGWLLIMNDLKQGVGPLPYTWFIVAIIIEYLGFYFSALLLGKRKSVIISMILYNCLLVLIIVVCKLALYWYISLFCIPAGMIVCEYEQKIRLSRLKAIILLFIFLVSAYASTKGFSMFKPFYFLYNILAATSTYLMIRLLGFPQNRFLNYLGGISLYIYLLHGVFIYFLTPLSWNPYVIMIVTLCGTIISAGLCNCVLLRLQRRTFGLSKP